MAAGLPSGTVTFLFTDLQGSTRAWETQPDAMRAALARHDSVMAESVDAAGGILFKNTGDGICAAFANPDSAILAALNAQRSLSDESSISALPISARMAVYTGPADPSGGDYVGPTLNRTARVLDAGHGSQVLVAESSGGAALPPTASLLDLGLHRLRDLERAERIYQLVHPDLTADFPPLRSLSAFAHNLPIQLTRLIGREQESLEVTELLAKNRLVTIAGSGGAGKTRLSLQVAAQSIDNYRDGAWFVDLGEVMDGALLAETTAGTLGLREEPGRDLIETIRQYLLPRSLLLILDNCEQIVDSAAEFAQSLLQTCPEIRILATSREYLKVPGEVQWRIPSLSGPDEPESDSVRLFADRAALCNPRFTLSPETVGPVAAICRRLDGIPLAIELAAARTSSLSVREIEQRLSERFLNQSSRAAVPRHQTLNAVMDWSFDLLSEPERALFRRLSVFAGGFTLEAAEFVTASIPDSPTPFEADDVLDLLTRLIEKSLVLRDDSGEAMRYRLLQMVREYGIAALDAQEADGLRDRHAGYFLGIAERFAEEITGPGQAEWLKKIDMEHANLTAALDWCQQNPNLAETGLLMAGDLARYWQIRGHFSEGRRHLAAMIATAPPNGPSPGWGKAHNGAGILAWAVTDFPSARRHYQSALSTWRSLGDRIRIGACLSNLGLLEIQEGDYDAGEAVLKESLSIREELQDRSGIAGSLANLSLLAIRRKEFTVAGQFIERSLELAREVGDNESIASSLNNLGEVRMVLQTPYTARPVFEESLEIYRALGDRMNCSIVLCNLGDAVVACERPDLARPMYVEALAIAKDLGDDIGARVAEESLSRLDSAR